METLGVSISNRVEHTDGLAASFIPELLPRASVTAFLDRLEQLETHRTLAELLVAPCRERDMNGVNMSHTQDDIFSFRVRNFPTAVSRIDSSSARAQSVGRARLSSQVVGGLLLHVQRHTPTELKEVSEAPKQLRFQKLRYRYSRTAGQASRNYSNERYGRNPILLPFSESYDEQEAIRVMHSFNGLSSYNMEKPRVAYDLFEPVALEGFPHGFPILLSTQMSTATLQKARRWIEEAGYLDGNVYHVRAFILAHNIELSGNAFGRFHFWFPSFGSVESHVDFGGTFSVGFCHDRVYDMKLMMKQTIFNVLFLTLLAAHMWWAVCRMGEKRSPSGDSAANTSAGQISAVRPAYWRSSNDFQSLWTNNNKKFWFLRISIDVVGITFEAVALVIWLLILWRSHVCFTDAQGASALDSGPQLVSSGSFADHILLNRGVQSMARDFHATHTLHGLQTVYHLVQAVVILTMISQALLSISFQVSSFLNFPLNCMGEASGFVIQPIYNLLVVFFPCADAQAAFISTDLIGNAVINM